MSDAVYTLPPPGSLGQMPDELVRAFTNHRPPRQATADTTGDPIPEGGRNAALTSLAGTMRRRGMTGAAIEAALRAENTARCTPPLHEEEVNAIARSVASYEPAEPAMSSTTRAPKLARLDLARMLHAAPDPVPWLIEPMIVRGALTLLYGKAGEGKSLLALALAVAIASGEGVAGFDPTPGRVLYIDAENGPREIHRRIHAFGVPEDAAGNLALYGAEALDLRADGDMSELERIIREEQPALMVLDSFRTIWSGSENDPEIVAPVMDRLRNLGREHDTATLLLHHTNKGGTGYRGSTAIGASAELAYLLAREPNDPDTQRRYLHCEKSRPAPEPPRRWLRLSAEMGMTLIDEAEPFESDEARGRPPVIANAMAPKVVAALRVCGTALKAGEVATAVGRTARDGTVRRVLQALVSAGQLERTEDRRYRLAPDPI